MDWAGQARCPGHAVPRCPWIDRQGQDDSDAVS